MVDEIKTLNLDDLLGASKAVKVRKDQMEYELAKLDALGVHKVLQFQGFRRQVTMLQLVDEPSKEQAEQIEILFDKMLRVLCEDLPLEKFTYVEKTRILGFYFVETAPKKAGSPRAEQTGAEFSPS